MMCKSFDETHSVVSEYNSRSKSYSLLMENRLIRTAKSLRYYRSNDLKYSNPGNADRMLVFLKNDDKD
jgi:hypothetical protein